MAMLIGTDLCVIHSVYWSGSLMWMYLSRLMAQRLMMLAVLHITSEEIQILQNVPPKFQVAKSLRRAKGMTTVATRRSAMARLTRNRLDSLRKLYSVATAMHTCKLGIKN